MGEGGVGEGGEDGGGVVVGCNFSFVFGCFLRRRGLLSESCRWFECEQASKGTSRRHAFLLLLLLPPPPPLLSRKLPLKAFRPAYSGVPTSRMYTGAAESMTRSSSKGTRHPRISEG